MYLICPSGLMDVLYSAFAHDEYKSSYWQEKNGMHIFKFDWDGATYIYSEKRVKFKKMAVLDLMAPNKTYKFQVITMEKMVEQKTGLIENLTFEVFEMNEHANGSFFLTMYNREYDIYDMNHMKRNEDEDRRDDGVLH